MSEQKSVVCNQSTKELTILIPPDIQNLHSQRPLRDSYTNVYKVVDHLVLVFGFERFHWLTVVWVQNLCVVMKGPLCLR